MGDTAQTVTTYFDAPADIKSTAASVAAWATDKTERSLIEGAATAALWIERTRNEARLAHLAAESEKLRASCVEEAAGAVWAAMGPHSK